MAASPTRPRAELPAVCDFGAIQTATVEDYDPMGRPADFWQCTSNQYDCPPATVSSLTPSQYTYDLAGDLTIYLTPSNGDCHITTTHNAAQQVTQVNSCTVDEYHPAILGQFTYTPWGAISTLTDGCVGSCTGLVETYAYNNRLQPAVIELGTAAGSSSDYCEVYYYYSLPPTDFPTTCSAVTGSGGNNGDVQGYVYNDNTGNYLTQGVDFAYDALNRLTTAGTVAGSDSQYYLDFTYDQYGNMTCKQGTGYCPQTTVDSTTNRLNSANYYYDAAGDETNGIAADGSKHAYQYDAEGRLISVDGGTTASYIYNALGQRVEEYNSTDPVNTYLLTYYDALGNEAVRDGGTDFADIVTEEDLFPTVAGRNYVKFDDSGTLFMHTDAIGSTGMATGQDNGGWQETMYYPFGQVWHQVSCQCDIRFAGLRERDTGSGFDPTPSRQYASTIGRWMTPDPGGRKAVDLTNPQSWNMYAYALNNPTTRTDPSGLCTADGESHNWVWCAAHALGFTTTLTERRNWLIQNNVVGVTRTGAQIAIDWKNASSNEVNSAYGSVESSLRDAEILDGACFGCALLNSAGRSLGANPASTAVGMLGESGAQFTSKTLWSEGDARIDVENPAPGERPGQIHYQDETGKYIYNVDNGRFEGLSSAKNAQLLDRPEIMTAIQKGLKYLGESQ